MKIPAVVPPAIASPPGRSTGRARPTSSSAGVRSSPRWRASCSADPEVSEVWVVGDADRLAAALAGVGICGAEAAQAAARGWSSSGELLRERLGSYRRLLPGAGQGGPRPEQRADRDSGRALPLGRPALRHTSRRSRPSCAPRSRRDDYALGVVGEECVESFYPAVPDGPGIRSRLLQPARRPGAPEQPAPGAPGPGRQPPLHRGDVRAPLPEGGREHAGRSAGAS